jgi:uncharacterized repeat protein (TIGR01451 family)
MKCNTTFGFVWSPVISFTRLGQWKRTLMAAAIALAMGSASAQTGGTVNFGNHSSSLVINGPTSLPVTAADNIRAALYWAPLESSTFGQLGASVAVGTPLPGLFVGGTRTNGPATPGASSGLFQVRAWGGGYGTYEEALLHAGVLVGRSVVITNRTGDPWGSPPSGPVSLLNGGFQSFTLQTNSGPSQPPAVACVSNKTVQCGSAWVFDDPTAVDGCTGSSLPVYVLSTVTNGQCPQVITRTWAATNSCDTSHATCDQVVTVVDTSTPTLTSPSDKTVNCDTNWTYDTPSGFNPCTGTSLPVWVLSTVSTNAGPCTQFFTRTWVVTNSCNANVATGSQIVTVTCSNCPVIAVTKQCPPHPVPPGGTLIFTGTVTNAGNVTLTDVLVVNDQPAPSTVVYGPATLAPGAGVQFSASYRVPPCSCGPFVDTLTASGTSIYGGVVTSFATSTCQGTNAYAVAGDLNGDGIVDQGELDAVLANYWASSQWVYMTNPATLGRGFFQFALTNATSWNFTVLASSNAVDWTSLPGPAYPVYQFYDPAAASNAPMRVYRLRWP